MLLTISTTATGLGPATDLGHLLHKHPDRVQEFRQSIGVATVFYPEATDERCTAALLLDVDPVRLARSRRKGTPDFSLSQYVNDRPYAASSLLAVALAHVFSTARSGRCDARQALADTAIPLEIAIPVLPCRGGPQIAHEVFAPLGWSVTAIPIVLDDAFPGWGNSRYVRLTLVGTVRLSDALHQLHVLLPALDESKHYWQGDDEVEKLLRAGAGWLAEHPARELITRRYLGRHGGLARTALARLAELDGLDEGLDDGFDESTPVDDASVVTDPHRPLPHLRHEAVAAVLSELGATSVIDLGCGGGQLLADLLGDARLARVTGVDVSTGALRQSSRRLRVEEMAERVADRLTLFQGALTYEDSRFAGYDAAVLMEVIEHVDPTRLPALAHVVFGTAAPTAVVVTTPNVEFNVRYPSLSGPRHADHRFEWTRAEFAAWCDQVATAYGYVVEHRGIGDVDPDLGTPTQMGVFRRAS